MTNFKLSATLSGHEQDVRAIIAPTDDLIVSASRDATVRIWSPAVQDNSRFQSTTTEALIAFHSPTNSFMNSVTFVDTEGHEPLIASGGQDAMIYLSDLSVSDRKPGDDVGKYQLIGHAGNVCSLFYKDGLVISGSWDATAKVWDLETFSVKFDLKGHEYSVWDVKILDSNTFLTCSADKTIRLWNGSHEVKRFSGHSDVVRKLLIFPDGKRFASASNDGTIKIWDLQSGNTIQTLYGHDSFVYDLQILPNGDLVSTGEDRTIRIWRDGIVIQVITLPCISVWCVAVLPNSDIAVGGSDKTVRVFTREASRIAPEAELTQFKESVQQSSIAEQSLDNLQKTDIPGYDALTRPGKQEGATIMVKTPSGVIEAHQWSGGEWVKIGDVVGSASSGTKHTYNGQEYDYLFDVDIEDGAPPLKLPYNVNENVFTAAQRFLADNDLPSSYTDEVVQFINKNTAGINLSEQTGNKTDSYDPTENPYSDSYQAKHSHKPTTTDKLKVIPETTYISFKDYKEVQLITGLKKLNEEQEEGNRFSEGDIEIISGNLKLLTSREASELVTAFIPKIVNTWTKSSRLIGYDLLRVSIPRITTVDLIRSTDAAETVLKALTTGLEIASASTIPLLMMILKTLNNLIGNTLFVQLYIDPSEDGKYNYNEYFQKLLNTLKSKLFDISTNGKFHKLYNTTITTLATLIYNLSAYHVKTTGLKSNPTSSKPIVDFTVAVGDVIVESNSEAAYRLAIAYGNFRYAKAFDVVPEWLEKAGEKYVKSGEQRFIDLSTDLQHLS
ncbi:WD40-repeat-containing domain protein [Scheffersomyces xylosifermentans]|uniref:WD40-repeat-containing domain protein n=1 Tax=Scheffersomyces xylosifermentans TaxID=1304137 RepID=UPI00315C5500